MTNSKAQIVVIFERLLKYLSFVGASFAVVRIIFLMIKSAVEFRGDAHDVLSYHLQLALKPFGLTTFIPRIDNFAVRVGYAPLAHWVMGLLVKLTGQISAAFAVNSAGVIITFALLFFADRKRWNWPWLIIMLFAIPMFPLHIASGFIDLWVSCGVVICTAGFIIIDKKVFMGVSLIILGIAWATFSKMSTWPAMGVAWVLALVSFWRLHNLKWFQKFFFSVLLTTLFAFWPLRNVVKYGNPTYPFEPAFAKGVFESLPNYKYYKDLGYWPLQELTQMATPKYLWTKPRFIQFLSSSFELSRFLTDEHFRWTPDQNFGGPDHDHHRQGGWFFLTWILLLLSCLLIMIRSEPKHRNAGLFVFAMAIVAAISPQSNELRYYLFVPMSMAVFIAANFDLLDRRWRYPLQIGFLFAAVYVWSKLPGSDFKIRPSTVSDSAPQAAKDFWKHCPQDRTVKVCTDDPYMIYWAGPTLNECPVEGCVVNCYDCHIDVRTDRASKDDFEHHPKSVELIIRKLENNE